MRRRRDEQQLKVPRLNRHRALRVFSKIATIISPPSLKLLKLHLIVAVSVHLCHCSFQLLLREGFSARLFVQERNLARVEAARPVVVNLVEHRPRISHCRVLFNSYQGFRLALFGAQALPPADLHEARVGGLIHPEKPRVLLLTRCQIEG